MKCCVYYIAVELNDIHAVKRHLLLHKNKVILILHLPTQYTYTLEDFPRGKSTTLRHNHDPAHNVLTIGKPGVNIAADFTITIN